jgi:S1-C subfamily serine protease
VKVSAIAAALDPAVVDITTTVPEGAAARPPRPAARPGPAIVPGDTIVTVGAATISSAADLSNALAGHEPGQSATVGWVDPSGATRSASVQLTTGPPA